MILTHVRVSDDVGDAILEMLGPMMDEPGNGARGEEVRRALDSWNADAVWAFRERERIIGRARLEGGMD